MNTEDYWVNSETPPPKPGMYMAQVETMDGPIVFQAWYEPQGSGNMEGWQLMPEHFIDAISYWGYTPPPMPLMVKEVHSDMGD